MVHDATGLLGGDEMVMRTAGHICGSEVMWADPETTIRAAPSCASSMRVRVVCQRSSQRLLLQSSDVSPLAERSCRPGRPQRAEGNLHFLEFLLGMKGFRPSILVQVQHLYRELKEFLVKIPEE